MAMSLEYKRDMSNQLNEKAREILVILDALHSEKDLKRRVDKAKERMIHWKEVDLKNLRRLIG